MSILQVRHNLNAGIEQLQCRGESLGNQLFYDTMKSRADGELSFAQELLEKAQAEVVDAELLLAEVEVLNPVNPANNTNTE